MRLAHPLYVHYPKAPRAVARVRALVRARWDTIVEDAISAGLNPRMRRRFTLACPGKASQILGSSTKTEKSRGTAVKVQYLTPANLITTPRASLCSWADRAGCKNLCLGTTSGHLGADAGSARRAQVWRTVLLAGAPTLYAEWVLAETKNHVKACNRAGVKALIRLDGTSDLGLSTLPIGEAIRAMGAGTYDYTKSIVRATTDNRNGHVVIYSHSPNSSSATDTAIASGLGIAVVFATRDANDFPKTWRGVRVFNGDSADDRSEDRAYWNIGANESYIVALTQKGRGQAKYRKAMSAFSEAIETS